MTLGKASALVAAFIAVFTLGVWTGPRITHHWETFTPPATEAHVTTPPAKPSTSVVARPLGTKRQAESSSTANTLSPSAPEVQRLVKPLLNRGTNMNVAAEGFHSAEQFAAVAHAAKNTDVPFMVLKHRVLVEKKPLSTAIRESKPDINVAAEAALALGEARRDISSLEA